MRSKIRVFSWCIALLGVSAVSALSAPRTVYFWSSAVGLEGARAGVDSARLGTWGNGAYRETRSVLYEGAQTLEILTRNFREGVRFDLKTPPEIEPYRAAGYLRLRIRFRDAVVAPVGGEGVPGQPPGVGVPPGFGGGGFGGAPPFGAPPFGAQPKFEERRAQTPLGPLPQLGNMGGLPIEGATPIVTGPAPQTTNLSRLLCTLVLDNGVMEGTVEIPKQWNNPAVIDFDKVHPDANGWLLFALPIKEMRATPNAGGAVRRLIISGDAEDQFFLTQTALVVETEKMTVSIRRLNDPPGTQLGEINIKPGPITLVAEVEAGAADPSIEWNFDADNVGNLPLPVPEGALPGMTPGEGVLPLPGATPVEPLPGAPAGVEGAPIVVGPRIDARGLIAKFEYPNEEQNYRVEVTVRDRSGKKEPVTASLLVRVRA